MVDDGNPFAGLAGEEANQQVPAPPTDGNPFASPSGGTAASPARKSRVPRQGSIPEYGSPESRALWAMWLIGACAVCLVLLTFMMLDLQESLAVFQKRSGYHGSHEVATKLRGQAFDLRGMAVFTFAVQIASVVLFLMGMHRAYRNLPALGNRYLRTTPARAVGWWFIPIMNLFRPYQVMSEIYRGSVPERSPEAVADLTLNPRSRLVLAWWLWFWLTGIVNGVLAGVTAGSSGPGDIPAGSAVDSMVNVAMMAVRALLTIWLIYRVTHMQQRRYRLHTSIPAADHLAL